MLPKQENRGKKNAKRLIKIASKHKSIYYGCQLIYKHWLTSYKYFTFQNHRKTNSQKKDTNKSKKSYLFFKNTINIECKAAENLFIFSERMSCFSYCNTKRWEHRNQKIKHICQAFLNNYCGSLRVLYVFCCLND